MAKQFACRVGLRIRPKLRELSFPGRVEGCKEEKRQQVKIVRRLIDKVNRDGHKIRVKGSGESGLGRLVW
jgi:hypothetical protein